jgi:hypothetical protein
MMRKCSRENERGVRKAGTVFVAPHYVSEIYARGFCLVISELKCSPIGTPTPVLAGTIRIESTSLVRQTIGISLKISIVPHRGTVSTSPVDLVIPGPDRGSLMNEHGDLDTRS